MHVIVSNCAICVNDNLNIIEKSELVSDGTVLKKKKVESLTLLCH